MCLIIHRPSGSEPIASDTLTRMLAANSHGWGIMSPPVRPGARPVIARGMDSRSLHGTLRALGSREFTLHARFATHSKPKKTECHPYKLPGGAYYLMHNGVIDGYPDVDAHRSDTWNFGAYVLAPILAAHPDWFDGPDTLNDLIGPMIGSYNKLVIMRAVDGAVRFVNRKAGVEHGEHWHSNSGALTPARPATLVRYSTGWPESSRSDRELVELTSAYSYRPGRGDAWEEDAWDQPEDVACLLDIATLADADALDYIKDYPRHILAMIQSECFA
jgi:hypothetical protein